MSSDIVDVAARVLAQRWEGVRVELDGVLDAYDGFVTAARLRVAGADIETVVVKRPGNWMPYDPDSSEGTAPDAFNEWAALTFLDGSDVAPRPFAFDPTTGLRVIEDLGDGSTLADALLGDDAGLAERAMVETARCLGELHATTAPRLDAYDALRDGLGPHGGWYLEPPDRAAIERTWELFGVRPGPAAREEVDAALDAIARPGPFRALTHGDPCPDNVFLVGDRAVLIDFDTAVPRHALWDGAYAHVPFPSCWCVNAVPVGVRVSWERAYRAALGDPPDFDDALGHAWLVTLLVSAARLVAEASDEDRTWGIATYRQRILHRFTIFAEATPSSALETLARDVVSAARARWPETPPLPVYPAFPA